MTLEEAVAYLKEEDLATMAVGTYEVDGDFYFMIQEYETKEATIVQTKTLSPNQGWTLKVKPNYNHGQLGLEITIDETTVDEPIDIIIPPNWK